MPVSIDGSNFLVKKILEQRKEQHQAQTKLKGMKVSFTEYGSTVTLTSQKEDSKVLFEYRINIFSQLDQNNLTNFLQTKKISNVKIDKANRLITAEFDASNLNGIDIENVSRIQYYCTLSVISAIFDKNNQQPVTLNIDDINSLFCWRQNDLLQLIYTIQTQVALEDQILMETFVNQFTMIKFTNGASFRYTRDRPQKLPAGTKRVDGVYYAQITLPDKCLEKQASLEKILFFHHIIHMHMKAAKTALTIFNNRFLNEWQKKYNRCLA